MLLETAPCDTITAILPFPDRVDAVSAALERAHGAPFPEAGRVEEGEGVRFVWSGQDEALALGARVEVDGAATVDVSDGYAALRLNGSAVAEVLSRLCPVDLRPAAFPPGSAVRTLLGHADALLIAEEGPVLILVARSVADHVVEEIERAMRGLASRS